MAISGPVLEVIIGRTAAVTRVMIEIALIYSVSPREGLLDPNLVG